MTSKRYRWTGALVVLIVISGFLLFQNQDPLYQRPPQSITSPQTTPEVDWSRFAYTQYVTDRAYLCNSIMIFESLHRLSSKADRVIMFPSHMLKSDDDDREDARLLLGARDKYNVTLVPITIQHKDTAEGMLPVPGITFATILTDRQRPGLIPSPSSLFSTRLNTVAYSRLIPMPFFLMKWTIFFLCHRRQSHSPEPTGFSQTKRSSQPTSCSSSPPKSSSTAYYQR